MALPETGLATVPGWQERSGWRHRLGAPRGKNWDFRGTTGWTAGTVPPAGE